MSLDSSSVVLRDRKRAGVSVSEVDTGARLVAGLTSTLEPDEALRIRRKIDRYVMPLMIQFMDKLTLGSAAILGIQLGTAFYLGYILFEYPQNLALQRFPVGKWMSINIFAWAIVLACHAACKSFRGLLVVRLLLGVCEGSITAGFLIVSSMFYTRMEQTLRVGYWSLMIGTAQIISGFISFGVLHIKTTGFEPWQWLMVITAIMTMILAISFWFLFPDSPTNAWFLTPDERVKAVQRLKENQTGVENKHFKMEQVIEALTDPKTWLFALLSALCNVPSSLLNQQSLILASFGFSYLQTTLLSCIPGVIQVLIVFTGVRLAIRQPNSRAYVAAMYFVPAWLGVLLVNLLPWSNRVCGLLLRVYQVVFNIASRMISGWTSCRPVPGCVMLVVFFHAHRSIAGFTVPGFVLTLSWLNNVTAGHTKKVVTNATILSAYCIGNAAGPLMWKAQYKPRNHVPWAVIGTCYVVCPLLLLVIRAVLARENRIRDAEPVDDGEEYVIERITEDGKHVEVKVDKEFLDLTDRQNRDFRYVL
ncbi:MFS general substrate transporter [Suillus subalutaceus]|uniref:MFS general substrate transporter n=1 Tax=Suillus subalutaceus TaxID=48586 RepID=UPI001B85C046|nr:MFS general substrate transporter [Suillus subalutaceus]KAG1852262.1 MFS general substrate transporter [Suillus subalutaceus]